jgi:hypothetical protein
VDFTSILSKSADAVEKPKPKPVGSYLAAIQGQYSVRQVETKDGERNILQFMLKALSAGPDVDASQLDGNVTDWPPFRYDIWVNTPEDEYRLKQFLEGTLEIPMTGKTFSEGLAETPGKQLTITLGHRPYQDKATGEPAIATEVKSVAKA